MVGEELDIGLLKMISNVAAMNGHGTPPTFGIIFSRLMSSAERLNS